MRVSLLLLAGLGAGSVMTVSVPARADWDRWREREWREHQWREHEWRERSRWYPRGYVYEPQAYAPPPMYYARPPVFYPPTVFYTLPRFGVR